ncbi:hypothetical protein [Streptomyces sp. NPDC088115]|uniref:hypothetical protein n=1 Tax=Streptomyces sp. NPDC088115 TaxID=3365824 RepID=UPI00382A9DC9
MTETPLDRVARALADVPIRYDDGVPVVLGLAVRLDMAHAALSALDPELERPRQGITEVAAQPGRVLPAKFVTDAMAQIPDSLPRDFA